LTGAPAAVLTIVLPLAGAPLLLLARGRQAAAIVCAVMGGVAATVALTIAGVWRTGPVRYALGGWGAPLGIELNVDGLAAVLLGTTALILLAVALYATPTGGWAAAGASRGRTPPFWTLLLFLWASLNALFLSSDLFNLYVALELLGLAAVALVALGGTSEALSAAMRYLLVSWLGSMAYLLGVAFLYAEYGVLELSALGAVVTPGPGTWTALVAITLGLALKTALFPFHGWLPAAHGSAPTPVSALLSSLVVTASFYVLLRLWVAVFGAALAVPLVQFVGLLGALAVVWGALLALRQERLKLIVAFSTVSQLGYLFVVFPVALGATRTGPLGAGFLREASYALGADAAALTAWNGGVIHAVSHAVAKAAMFLAAGGIIHALGHDRVADFRGLAERAPATVLAFGVAGLSLIGLPPTGGFLAKWWMISAALERGQWGWALVMLAGSLLTAGYVFRVLGAALQSAPEDAPPLRPVPRTMQVAAMGLAIFAVVLGHWSTGPLRLLSLSEGFPW